MEIKIERFKNLSSVEFEIKGISLLVGGNNSGKSSVLQAIQFGVSAAQTSASQGGIWNEDRLSTSIGQSDLVYSPIKDVHFLAHNGRLREPPAEAICITYKDNNDEAKITVRKGRNKNILLELVGRTLGERLQSMQNPYCTLVTGLAGIPAEEEFETNSVVRKAAAKGDSNSVFRNILLQLKNQQPKWARFNDQIRRIFNGYEIDVVFDQNIDEVIECTVSKSGLDYPIDTCGTGVLQAVQIFSYINLFEPKILLLDEPDSHLHPNNQKQLAKELIKAAENGLNIIVSTHSKHLVESLIDNSKLIWLKDGVKQPNIEDYDLKALMDIGALNIGERIGNPAFIFLTEDKNSEALEILLESNGYDLEECEIISYSGCTQISTAIALINHLRKSNPDANYAIHRDKDFMSQHAIESYKQKFSQMNVKAFFPEGNDIEYYFTRPEHISASCNINLEAASALVERAYQTRRDDLIAKYVNSRIVNIKKLGEQVDAGAISVECNQLMTDHASPAVHAKILMKGIRDELQKNGIADHIISSSNALEIESLRNLFTPPA